MKVDARATKAARARHAAGVKKLDEVFAATPVRLASAGIQHGRARPVRLKPNTPPLRDADHQARHRRRKVARASRKRNRA